MDLPCRPADDRTKRFWKRFAGRRAPVGHCLRIGRANLRKDRQLSISVDELHRNVELQ